jgi:hypothetical protein
MRKLFDMYSLLALRQLLLGSVAIGCLALGLTPAHAEDDGFSLSVDGEVIAGSETLGDRQRKADIALNEADIQVKFDGLDVKPILNVSIDPAKSSYELGEEIAFVATTNYGAWLTRAEVLISEVDGARARVIARLPVNDGGKAKWRIPAGMNSKLVYVLRVYDKDDRYDETKARALGPSDLKANSSEDGPVSDAPAGLNEDNTSVRNIPVYGGAVTIYGRGVDGNSKVYAFGEKALVDGEGNFLVQRILPPGDHAVDVEVRGSGDNNLDFTREINIPTNEWFYVGLADFTLGRRFGNNDMKAAYPGEFDKFYNKGRLAFYLKGKMKGSTLLTAALDTDEHDVRNILKRIDDKDPRRFLKRIDPDDYYPVYGDDSTTIEDAPTSGHFYVRLQKDDSHIMWGNYKAYVNGNKFLTNERALYGAQGVYRSKPVMLDGSRSTEISAHAAQPGTLVQSDTLRGTGGSAYFLKHQDITRGSETVSKELRDSVTGFVVSKTAMKIGTDYEFDYSQGVLLLNAPLPSSEAGRDVYLVVNYEFTPATGDVKGYAIGGRAQQWLGEHVRVGLTGMRDYSGDADLTLGGADVRVQAAENTYLDLHAAQSKGRGFGYSASVDGGLTYTDITPLAGARKRANAYGAEARVDLGELTSGSLKGDLEANYAYRQGGFSTLDEQVTERKEDVRLAARIDVTEKTSLGVEGTQSRNGANTDRALKGIISHELTDATTVQVYGKDTHKSAVTSPVAEKGNRLDLGAKVIHELDADTNIYVFGQATVSRSGNRRRDDRAGIGGKTDLSEKVSLEAEVSGGSEGPGGVARLVYTPNADTKYYVGYELDPYRDLDANLTSPLSGDDLGHIIFGGRQQVSEELSFYVEDSYDIFGVKRTLAQTYGVDYKPMEHWSLGAQLEMGHVFDDNAGAYDFDRKAASVSVGYSKPEGHSARLKAEARRDDFDDPTKGDVDAYLLAADVNWKANENWRLLGTFDAVFTDSTEATRKGKYVEASLGYAYRPVEDDKLNALFKYTFLYDLPGNDQVTVDGTTNGPYQRSHIISADVIYDLNEIFSVGAKYGMRYGETKDRSGGSWVDNVAHLAVIRGDMNIDREWELMLEGRMLWSPTSDSSQLGALAALYRHMSENFKLGVGYNFGRFSDDLADLTADDHGVFINAIGKF